MRLRLRNLRKNGKIVESISPSESTSLVPSNDKPKRPIMSTLKGEKTDVIITNFKAQPLYFISFVAFILGVVTSFFFTTIIVDVSSLFLVFFCPYVVYQKRQLTKLGGFRQQLNRLRESVNVFMGLNDSLTRNISDLKFSVHRLKEVEEKLSKVAYSSNVDRLVEIVKETKQVNREIKENIKAKVVQDILSSVLRTDRNADLSIGNAGELKQLMTRLKNMPGFQFHEDRFLQILGAPTEKPIRIGKIMELIRNLLDDPNSQENVFVWDDM